MRAGLCRGSDAGLSLQQATAAPFPSRASASRAGQGDLAQEQYGEQLGSSRQDRQALLQDQALWQPQPQFQPQFQP
ncbi:MAG: hypothetical protein ACRCTP_18155 [Aeromonas popoffii]|uniref:hypothetical protein n=1 Tax=Aeromonas popoffii TaxID=70856 RepID=UPI003F34604C